jgi:hypothetical protein
MEQPRIFVDFHNADAVGRVRLNCVGTVEDLARQGIVLRNGQKLTLYGEELEADGQVEYSAEDQMWTAVIDWDAIRENPVALSGAVGAAGRS